MNDGQQIGGAIERCWSGIGWEGYALCSELLRANGRTYTTFSKCPIAKSLQYQLVKQPTIIVVVSQYCRWC